MKSLGCSVFPQHVGTGKPNWGLEWPSGTGAAVLCSFSSFWANESPDGLAFDEPRLRKSVTRK